MAMITYDNKSTLNPQPSVADANKVTSDDMNEIKSVVNTNYGEVGDITTLTTTNKSSVVNAINELKSGEEYSTTEVKTNKVWIDNKPIYRKAFEVVLNNQSMNVSHNINNFGIILIDESMSEYRNGNKFIPLNYFYSTTDYSRVIVADNQIQIRNKLTGTISDWTAYITLEYTKTTD